MEKYKAYFVETDTEDVYELSKSKHFKLNKLIPNWRTLDCQSGNFQKLLEFVRSNGKKVASNRYGNSWIGLTDC